MKKKLLGLIFLISFIFMFRSNNSYKCSDIKKDALLNETKNDNLEKSIKEECENVPYREEYKIAKFPIISQMPELPTGCEITALAMMLNFYGFKVDKETLAYQYLPTVPAEIQYGEDGLLYGPDMEKYFVGDPGGTGYICGTTAIVTAANHFFSQTNSHFFATSMKNMSSQEVYELLNRNIPVLVWVTIGMEPRLETQGWYTKEGKFMEWAENDHGAVVIGYDETSVIIADPILGEYRCDKMSFEEVFLSRGGKCAIIQNKK